jgi:hypothetical protein
MVNQILNRRICRMIAITYAVNEDKVWADFEKYNSIDTVIKIANGGEDDR